MTIEEYYAIVHKLHLTRTNQPHTFFNEEGGTQYVRSPLDLNDEERRAYAKQLINACGRDLSEFGLNS